MSVVRAPGQLELPESLQSQLHDFRRRVWSIKTIESVLAATFGVVAAFLAMFAMDRVGNTPIGPRVGLFVLMAAGFTLIPLALYRWVWRNRQAEQLARLLTRKHPLIGDQLLGVIELAHNASEQKRSRRLVEAAIEQVAEDARKRDFSDAVPSPKHRLFAMMLAVPTVAAVALFAFVPDAAKNSWARLITPWSNTPRYTFAAIQPLPDRTVVAHGEPYTIVAKLADKTAWKPETGQATLGTRQPVTARLVDGNYTFEMPSQIDTGWLDLKIGDFRHRVKVEPMLRPELATVSAQVALPAYLGLPRPVTKDVRSGSTAVVKGSRVTVLATAGRALSSAWVDGQPVAPSKSSLSAPSMLIDGSRKLEFRWKDTFGLSGKEPFTLTINGRDDEAPSLGVEDLPRQKVVLDSEQLAFTVQASDDFGIKRVGIEWQGSGDPTVATPAKGEKLLAAGGPDKESLSLKGTFSAKSLGIEPQMIELRVFAEDYFPGRARVYTAPYVFYVLSPEQHAIWLTEQLSKWHRQSLEVRDREMQLFETNKQIRALSQDELDQPETRKRIEAQAAAEKANGRRLSGLVTSGEDLVRQAMRNPEFGVGHLEKWGEMLQILKDISGNRMPSVADLLKQAASAPSVAMANPKPSAPAAGKIRAAGGGGPGPEETPDDKKKNAVPSVVDRESQHENYGKPGEDDPAASKTKPSSPSLSLAQTTLGGKAGKSDPPPPVNETVNEAVVQQEDLLAEFERIAEELNTVLANLEGSTLVKRLKAASREQYKIAGRISDQVADTFGVTTVPAAAPPAKVLAEMAEQEAKGSHDVSLIMDDMQSYFERRQFLTFKTVLDDMKKQDVIGALRQLGDELKKENGVSIAQCEYWSDTMDRWAEDLVDPASGGT